MASSSSMLQVAYLRYIRLDAIEMNGAASVGDLICRVCCDAVVALSTEAECVSEVVLVLAHAM